MEVRSPRARCRRGWFFLRAVREESVAYLSPSFWRLPGSLWCSLASVASIQSLLSSHSVLPVCVSVFEFSLFCQDIGHNGLGPTLIYICVCVSSVVADSLQLHGLKPTILLYPWNFQGKETGVGHHFQL